MATPPPQQRPQKESDGQVDSYQRVVNGKVIQVNAYAKKATPSTKAAQRARKIPGRPRMMAKPGSYAGGRDIPGLPGSAAKPAEETNDDPQQPS